MKPHIRSKNGVWYCYAGSQFGGVGWSAVQSWNNYQVRLKGYL